ncbi:class I SAM-dependent methyltransferase [Algoriphagus machipongonensis]|uniref:Ribosomal RNA adenine dimethylase phospholipid N-methyltransferase n=1 Tax=Algoriphagus machipongonensis TaxID=388413 RepID=A3HSN8_9BACT|nr:rRNA adenine N-6-methyltransferase family protein [Algoriphagus machipongonensis]EAZ82856.1 ribosomal RNA adenine dimethylase phospholipid N-methyltransferase [Algoriphagus machipongonensis]
MSKSDLLFELYSNLSTTGALTFSSKSLVNKMLSYSDLSQAKVVVELGGGDGSITKGIVDKLAPDAKLLVFEISESFCKAMEKKFSQDNVQIINDSAENIHKYLDGEKVDYIFSSLPFSFIAPDIQDEILKQSKISLGQTGFFIQICYSYLLRKLFKKHFSSVDTSFTLKNLPPAFVMVCK